ncbi:hypothetical protein B2K11_04175 [Microbacterium sp. B35-30]|nr:hypothetical protein B2K11_04175 [Microbacterium sp. B35-30]
MRHDAGAGSGDGNRLLPFPHAERAEQSGERRFALAFRLEVVVVLVVWPRRTALRCAGLPPKSHAHLRPHR